MGAGEGESLKPGGGATSGLGSGDPNNDVESDSSCVASFAFFGSSMLGPSSPQTPTVAMPPQLTQRQRGLPCGDHCLGGM